MSQPLFVVICRIIANNTLYCSFCWIISMHLARILPFVNTSVIADTFFEHMITHGIDWHNRRYSRCIDVFLICLFIHCPLICACFCLFFKHYDLIYIFPEARRSIHTGQAIPVNISYSELPLASRIVVRFSAVNPLFSAEYILCKHSSRRRQ